MLLAFNMLFYSERSKDMYMCVHIICKKQIGLQVRYSNDFVVRVRVYTEKTYAYYIRIRVN